MKIFELLSPGMGSNCFVIVDEHALFIDPGLQGPRVLNMARELHIGDLLFINTHCHYDHSGSIPELRKELDFKYMIHEKDAPAVENGLDEYLLANLFGEEPYKVKVDRVLEEGDKIKLGTTTLEIIHTPGHTKGSICLYEPDSKSLFTGDTVFCPGVGRTDLPGGNTGELKESIEKLMKLNEERGVSKIYPGHMSVGTGEDIERAHEMFF